MAASDELETQIYPLVGEFSGRGTGDRLRKRPDLWNALKDNSATGTFAQRQLLLQKLLREWLVAKGVPSEKVRFASDSTLSTAYQVGEKYLAKMRQPDRNSRRSFGRQDDLDIEIDDLEESKLTGKVDLLTQNLGETQRPQHQPETKGETKITFDFDQIAKAADHVLRPRIESAKQEIARGVKNEVEHQIDALGLGQSLTTQITDLATNVANHVAHALLHDALPKRLEIIESDIKRELPAEPRHNKFDHIFKRLRAGSHVYLVGPKGTGKTHLFQQLCIALGYNIDTEFYPIDQSLTKYDVKGYQSPTGEYIETLVYKAVSTGGFMCIDEGDMWGSPALGSLNSILAGNGYGTFANRVVKVHPNFKCIVAANTYGTGATREYDGRNPLDAASLDRFVFIPIDYDREMEKQLYGASLWLEYIWRVRDACEKLKMPKLRPSMRAIDKGIKGFSVGMTGPEICEDSLWMGADADTITKIKNLAGEPPETYYPKPRTRSDADAWRATQNNQTREAADD